MENKRMLWLDALRGLGIILITLGHLGCFELLERYIYSFHVPLFFFISGYLYIRSAKPIKNFIKRKTITILVPFLVWTLMSTLVNVVMNYDLKLLMLKMVTYNGLLTWNSPLWFLLVLYIVEILFAVLDRLNDKTYFKYIILAVSVVLFFIFGEMMLTLKLNLVPLAMIFYSMGNIMRTSLEQKPLNLKTWQKVTMVVLLFIVSFVFSAVLNVRIKYTHAIFGNIAHFLIAATAAILFYYIIFKNVNTLSNSKMLINLGNNSLIIMCAQYWVFRICDITTKRLFDYIIWHRRDTIKAILFTAFTLAVICGLTALYKKISKNNKVLQKIGEVFGIR
ncbi:MAG: hypothetical protein E7513_06635 [Ruminococcaceae bacterium]|nr:hypothetical protein [Oscillospiraceae bacterium]